MAIDTTYFDSDLDAMILDMPTAAKFGTTEFNVAASELSIEENLLFAGNEAKQGARAIFPITAFTATTTFKPQARFYLKFPDPTAYTNYEIVSISKTPDLVAYEVMLKADNRSS